MAAGVWRRGFGFRTRYVIILMRILVLALCIYGVIAWRLEFVRRLR
jgi:hypothetical protein